MKRTLLFLAGAVAACLPAVPAQQPANDANPLYRPISTRIGTIFVPPIPGAPFSATAVIENKQTMPDGSIALSRNINLIGRDSLGRTHGEMRRRVPADSNDTPLLVEVHLFDPQTGVQTVYNTQTHVATRQLRRPRAQAEGIVTPADPTLKVEDLGTSVLAGIEVQGTRRTVRIAANASGTGAPVAVTDEYWYSQELHVNLLLVHNDPRTGEQSVALTDIRRENPDASFFGVPEGYKIVDVTLPAPARESGREGGPNSSRY